jgi:hypothetical protein
LTFEIGWLGKTWLKINAVAARIKCIMSRHRKETAAWKQNDKAIISSFLLIYFLVGNLQAYSSSNAISHNPLYRRYGIIVSSHSPMNIYARPCMCMQTNHTRLNPILCFLAYRNVEELFQQTVNDEDCNVWIYIY